MIIRKSYWTFDQAKSETRRSDGRLIKAPADPVRGFNTFHRFSDETWLTSLRERPREF